MRETQEGCPSPLKSVVFGTFSKFQKRRQRGEKTFLTRWGGLTTARRPGLPRTLCKKPYHCDASDRSHWLWRSVIPSVGADAPVRPLGQLLAVRRGGVLPRPVPHGNPCPARPLTPPPSVPPPQRANAAPSQRSRPPAPCGTGIPSRSAPSARPRPSR